MSPKKAIVIVLVLFLVVIMVFAFLYLKKQLASPENALINTGVTGSNDSAGGTNDKSLTPTETIQKNIDKIIEEAKNNPAQNPPAEVRQDIVNTINAEIIKQEQNKTPEQTAAELKAEEARQKIIDQINNQIKQGATKP